MQIVALVGPRQATRIQQALSPRDTFTRVTRWHSLFHHLARSDSSAVVLNPRAADFDGSKSNGSLTPISRLRRVPFVVYVNPRDLRSAMAFVRAGAVDILLEDQTDSRGEIQAALRSTQDSSSELILRHVLDALSDKHAKVAELLAEFFRSSGSPATVAALAQRTTLSERSLYRAVSDAGLAPLGVIVRSARAARAFDLMRKHNTPLERAAHTLGYSSARRLSNHLRQLSGLPSVIECASLSQHEFVSAVLRELLPNSVARVS